MSSHKSNESNKIFAAILCALLTVMLAGFFVDKIIVAEKLEKNAIEIEGGAVEGGPIDTKPKLPDPIMALLSLRSAMISGIPRLPAPVVVENRQARRGGGNSSARPIFISF